MSSSTTKRLSLTFASKSYAATFYDNTKREELLDGLREILGLKSGSLLKFTDPATGDAVVVSSALPNGTALNVAVEETLPLTATANSAGVAAAIGSGSGGGGGGGGAASNSSAAAAVVPAAPARDMHITVKCMFPFKDLVVDAKSNETIAFLKARVAAAEGIPEDRLRVMNRNTYGAFFSANPESVLGALGNIETTGSLEAKPTPNAATVHFARIPAGAVGLSVFVKMLTGRTLEIWTHPNALLTEFKAHIQNVEGVLPENQRIIFGGRQLEDGRSLSSYNVIQGANLHLLLRFRADIGIFVQAGEEHPQKMDHTAVVLKAEDAPGAAFLADPTLLSSSSALPPAAAIASMVSAVSARAKPFSGDGVRISSEELVSSELRAVLMAKVDAEWKKAQEAQSTSLQSLQSNQSETERRVVDGSSLTDFRYLLSYQELPVIIGAEASATIAKELGVETPDAITLRRTTATGRWIGWHTDTAARTATVPLHAATDYVGGSLLFASPEGSLLRIPRAPGVLFSHDGDVVHGVTRLDAGVRYGLIALRSRV